MEIQWVRPVEFREIDRRRVEARVAELAREDSDMIDVRVTALPNSHHRHGGHEVRIACEASGHQIVATRTSADAGLALNEALAVFEREVRRMRHRRTEQRTAREHPAPAPEYGVVDEVFGEEGYGFILTDAGERVYFHRNAVQNGSTFGALEEGQRVGLQIESGEKGLQATFVRLAPEGSE